MEILKSRLQITLATLTFFLLVSTCKRSINEATQNDQAPEEETWKLIFEEEFNNLSAWNIWYGGAFNKEIQLYRKEQLFLENGILTIKAEREAVTGPTRPNEDRPKEFEYVSGRIESKELYGPSDEDGERAYRFMARIKLPYGKGMWPAFWLYGDPWPTQGEIDILEARGGEPNSFQSNIFYGPKPGISINKESEAIFPLEKNLTEDFHIYEMIWRENTIEVLFDEELIHTYKADGNNNISKLFGKKQKVVFNTAVGGWFISDTDANNFADSSTMEVDWLRIYKK